MGFLRFLTLVRSVVDYLEETKESKEPNNDDDDSEEEFEEFEQSGKLRKFGILCVALLFALWFIFNVRMALSKMFKNMPSSFISRASVYTGVVFIVLGLVLYVTGFLENSIHCTAWPQNGISREYVETICLLNVSSPWQVKMMTNRTRFDFTKGPLNQANVNLDFYSSVALFTIAQGILFLVTPMLWVFIEGGRLRYLLDSYRPLDSNNDEVSNNSGTINYLSRYMVKSYYKNNLYLLAYILCDFLGLATAIVEMLWLDYFLDGTFLEYGIQAMRYWTNGEEAFENPFLERFPRSVRCDVPVFSYNGNLSLVRSICLLPMNTLYDKLFLMEWFWTVTLIIFFTHQVINRILFLVLPPLEKKLMLSLQLSFVDKEGLSRVLRKTFPGDWFVLRSLSNNMTMAQFSKIIRDMDLCFENCPVLQELPKND